jgi:hypothetical protein
MGYVETMLWLCCTSGSLTLQSLVLVPPSVKQDLHFLVVTVHQVRPQDTHVAT